RRMRRADSSLSSVFLRSPTLSRSTSFSAGAATAERYTLSLHDALPICHRGGRAPAARQPRSGPGRERCAARVADRARGPRPRPRSEEHTSELQSRENLVCRLLLEKKKKQQRSAQSDASSYLRLQTPASF